MEYFDKSIINHIEEDYCKLNDISKEDLKYELENDLFSILAESLRIRNDSFNIHSNPSFDYISNKVQELAEEISDYIMYNKDKDTSINKIEIPSDLISKHFDILDSPKLTIMYKNSVVDYDFNRLIPLHCLNNRVKSDNKLHNVESVILLYCNEEDLYYNLLPIIAHYIYFYEEIYYWNIALIDFLSNKEFVKSNTNMFDKEPLYQSINHCYDLIYRIGKFDLLNKDNFENIFNAYLFQSKSNIFFEKLPKWNVIMECYLLLKSFGCIETHEKTDSNINKLIDNLFENNISIYESVHKNKLCLLTFYFWINLQTYIMYYLNLIEYKLINNPFDIDEEDL